MKKLFIFILIIFFCKPSFCQYPVQQNLGGNTTLISLGNANGGAIRGNLINGLYADTTAANATQIDFYAGAQIFTTSDTSFWIRNKTATNTYWFKIGGAGGGATGSFWGLTGNYIAVTPANLGIGTNDPFNDLPFKTNNTTRVILPLNGLERQVTTGAFRYMLFDTTNKTWGYGDAGGTTPISSLTAATGTNTIDNASFQQIWDWTTLSSGTAISFLSNSTNASGSTQKVVLINSNGANSNSSETTTSLQVQNGHSGTSSTNIAARFSATNGTNNYAIIVPSDGGNVGIGTSTPDSLLTVEQGIYGKRGVRFSGLPTGIPASAKRILMASDGTLYAADTTAGGGSSLTYSTNPSAWVTQKSVNNPIITSDMYTPNPVTEHTQYAPSPIIAADGNVWVYVKGDGYNLISVYKSTDRGESFTFIDSVIVQRASTYYSESATIPGAVADSANNLIHIYFQALQTGVTPDVFSIGKATAPFNDPSNVTVSSTPLITPADFVTQTSISFQPGYLNITSVVKTDSIYFFGTFWDGNADNPSGDFKIFMGSSATWDTIRNCRVILSPTGGHDLLRSPSVFLDNGLYKMILTDGYQDNDSATTLISAYSSDLKTWTLNSGTLLAKGAGGTWEQKRVYMAQVLKKSTGTFADPYYFPRDTTYGYPMNDNYTDAIKYYYSGSDTVSPVYNDYTGLAYLYPQRDRDDFFMAENDMNTTIINRNTTHIINIPNASDSTTGKLKSSDWATFNNKAPGSGSANYIQNKSATSSAQTSSSFHVSDSATIGKVLMVGGNTTSSYSLNVNANTGTGSYAGFRVYNSAISNKDFYYQVTTAGEITAGGNGTSGSYTLTSFATGMRWQSTYWRWREPQSPFNYIFEIDGTASANAVNIVPSAGKVGIGTYTKTALVTFAAQSTTANTAPIKLITGPTMTTAEAGALEYATPQLTFTNGGGVRQELFQGQQSRVSTQYDNTTTTLGNITGLTANVAAGKIYRFEAILYTTSNVAGGIKVAIGGTATATAIIYEAVTHQGGLTVATGTQRATALGTAVGDVTAVTTALVKVTGTITVNAAGTLTAQAAANAATGTTSVLVGSTFVLTEML